jgi:hypothetical protein
MSVSARFSVPGFTELPKCRCGGKLQTAKVDPFPEATDMHIRVYNCPACQHEMRLTVWGADALR